MRFLMPVGFLIIAAGFSAIVMLLWNWLIPSIFGLAIINFWQALGLLVLARILFGGFSHGRKMMHGGMMHKMHGGNPIREMWMKMTPEEREAFIQKRNEHFHRGRCEKRDFFDKCNTFEEGNTTKKENE